MLPEDLLPNENEFTKVYNCLIALNYGQEQGQQFELATEEQNDGIITAFTYFKDKYKVPLKTQISCCERHKKRGNEYFHQGNYKKAIQEFTIAICCNDNAIVYQNRALSFLKIESQETYNPYSAMLDMKKALDLNQEKKRETKFYYILSQAERYMGKPFHATMWLDQIKTMTENQAKKIKELKQELVKLEREEDYRQAHQPAPEDWNGQGPIINITYRLRKPFIVLNALLKKY